MPSRQAVLGIDDGAFFHGTRKIFSGVSFLLDEAKTALVGENGAGKSTLLGCLSGELELNAGKIVRSRDFAYWDADKGGWTVEPGSYDLLIGGSAGDIELQATVRLVA